MMRFVFGRSRPREETSVEKRRVGWDVGGVVIVVVVVGGSVVGVLGEGERGRCPVVKDFKDSVR